MAELPATALHGKATPSLQYNNLAAAAGKLAYVHRGEVYLLSIGANLGTSLTVKEASQVISISAEQLLVLTKQDVQIVSADQEKVLATIPLSNTDDFLTRGVAVIGDSAFVGHANGRIDLVNLKDAKTVGNLTDHTECITAIAAGVFAGEPSAASADMGGEVIIWSADGKVKAKIQKSVGDTPTSLAIANDTLFVGYGSGKIRGYDAQGTKKVEINAHGRWINAIAFDPASNTLASVGEDSLLQLWAPGAKIAYKGHKYIENALLTGVAFFGPKVYTAAYDCLSLQEVPLI